MKKIKSLPALKRELQILFNEFIRLRDKGKPCISCGKPRPLQAGHFYSVKMYDGLRFDEHNVNGECSGCNKFDDRHLINYNYNLPPRIGAFAYEELKKKAAFYKAFGCRWSRSEILEKIEYYKEKIKEL